MRSTNPARDIRRAVMIARTVSTDTTPKAKGGAISKSKGYHVYVPGHGLVFIPHQEPVHMAGGGYNPVGFSNPSPSPSPATSSSSGGHGSGHNAPSHSNTVSVPTPPSRPPNLTPENVTAVPVPTPRPPNLTPVTQVAVPVPTPRPPNLTPVDQTPVPVPTPRPANLTPDTPSVPAPAVSDTPAPPAPAPVSAPNAAATDSGKQALSQAMAISHLPAVEPTSTNLSVPALSSAVNFSPSDQANPGLMSGFNTPAPAPSHYSDAAAAADAAAAESNMSAAQAAAMGANNSMAPSVSAPNGIGHIGAVGFGPSDSANPGLMSGINSTAPATAAAVGEGRISTSTSPSAYGSTTSAPAAMGEGRISTSTSPSAYGDSTSVSAPAAAAMGDSTSVSAPAAAAAMGEGRISTSMSPSAYGDTSPGLANASAAVTSPTTGKLTGSVLGTPTTENGINAPDGVVASTQESKPVFATPISAMAPTPAVTATAIAPPSPVAQAPTAPQSANPFGNVEGVPAAMAATAAQDSAHMQAISDSAPTNAMSQESPGVSAMNAMAAEGRLAPAISQNQALSSALSNMSATNSAWGDPSTSVDSSAYGLATAPQSQQANNQAMSTIGDVGIATAGAVTGEEGSPTGVTSGESSVSPAGVSGADGTAGMAPAVGGENGIGGIGNVGFGPSDGPSPATAAAADGEGPAPGAAASAGDGTGGPSGTGGAGDGGVGTASGDGGGTSGDGAGPGDGGGAPGDKRGGFVTHAMKVARRHRADGGDVKNAIESAKQIIAYHGSPNKISGKLRKSDRGFFGPGAYLSGHVDNAKSYGKNVHAYHVPENIFSTIKPLNPDHERQIIDNIDKDSATRLSGYKNWYKNDGGAFWEALRRSAGGDEAASRAIQKSGFSGIEGIGDGHEIAVFDPSNLKRVPEKDPKYARGGDIEAALRAAHGVHHV